MTEGTSYLIALTNGFVFVGTYMGPTGLNDAILKDAHFITNCGTDTDWGRFVRNGPGDSAIVNEIGTATINLDFRLWSSEFHHMSKIIGKTR